MSTLADVISQINVLTGYNVPTGSGYIISQSANPIGSGSVNNIVNYINGLTGYNVPSTQVQYVSGSNVAGPIIIYTPYAAGGTIPTEGILPGGIIRAEHILRIINALNGVNVDTIIISGSFNTSGSNTLNGTLSLPFIPDGTFLYTSGGYVVGVDVPPSASFATTASYALTASYVPNLLMYQISTGSVTASVDVAPSSIFLIKSASVNLVSVDNRGSVAMSGSLTINTTGSFDKLMSVNNNSVEYFNLNNEGVLVLHQYTTPPTAVTGGMYFNTSGDLFLGV